MSGSPKFITFEGGDGSGKSTQSKLLSQAFEKQNIPHILTREPVGEIRSLLVEGEPDRWQKESEVLLHYAARCEHIADVIAPAMQQNKWIICDRYVDSTMAYQGYGHGVDKSFIKTLEKKIAGDFMPDLTLIFDIDPEIALKRTYGRGAYGSGKYGDNKLENRYEQMGLDFQKRLRDGFLQIAEENERCKIIDALRDIDEIQVGVVRLVNNFEKTSS